MSLCAFSFRFVSSLSGWVIYLYGGWQQGVISINFFSLQLAFFALISSSHSQKKKMMKKDRKSMTLNCYGRFCYKTRNWFNSQFFIYYLHHPNVHSVLFVCLFACFDLCSFFCTCCLQNTHTERLRAGESSCHAMGPLLNVHLMTQQFFHLSHTFIRG